MGARTISNSSAGVYSGEAIDMCQACPTSVYIEISVMSRDPPGPPKRPSAK
jgi:hypothetical protein